MVELRLLGTVELTASDGRDLSSVARQPKRMALLAFLAAAGPRGLLRRDKLIALFWPELDQAHARGALNQALYVLRGALGEDAVLSRGDEEIGLNDEAIQCDVVALNVALDEGRPADAMVLYRGELLEGVFLKDVPEFEHWLDRERARLRDRVSEGAWTLAESSRTQGKVVQAERWGRRAAELSGQDEAAVRRLMTFLSDLGDRAAAIQAYESYAWTLASDDLEPGVATKALAAAIRAEGTGDSSGLETEKPAGEGRSRPGTGSGQRLLAAKTPASRARRLLLYLALGAAVALGFWYATPARRPLTRHTGTAAAPRLLVLPFKNLGPAEDAYLADGISDEITTRLGSLPGIAVIGGETSRRYAASRATPEQIRGEIQIDYLLEGTVTTERAGSAAGKVRVRPRLIDARTGVQLWSAVVDEDLSDLFSLLSAISLRTTHELNIALDSAQQARITWIPTRNQRAYDYFLRAHSIIFSNYRPGGADPAIELLGKAIALDSSFALAFAWASYEHTQLFWEDAMPAEHLDTARNLAGRALRLDPDLAEGHLALGHYYYACCADYARALSEFDAGLAINGRDATVLLEVGNVHKRAGHATLAIATYERAANLDPQWAEPYLNLAQQHLWLRHFAETEEASRRGLAVDPREPNLYNMRAWAVLLRDGNPAAARQVLDEATKVADGYVGLRLPFYLELLRHRYDSALTRLGGSPAATVNLDEWLVDDEIRRGIVLRLRGDSAAARTAFASAVARIRKDLVGWAARSPPFEVWLRSGLAIALASLDRRDEARDEIRRVEARDPVALDAISGPTALEDLALAEVYLGNRAAAIALLERLLTIPAPLTPALLRLDPLWDPLRGEPEFQRLVQ